MARIRSKPDRTTMRSVRRTERPMSDMKLPFHAPALLALLRPRLPWDRDRIMSWIQTHALPILKTWKETVYDEEAHRDYLQALLMTKKPKKVHKAIYILTLKWGRRLLVADPYEDVPMERRPPSAMALTAKAAVQISRVSFQEPGWLAAFQMSDEGAKKIAVALLLDVYADMQKNGGASYARAMLEASTEDSKDVVLNDSMDVDDSGGKSMKRKAEDYADVDDGGMEDSGEDSKTPALHCMAMRPQKKARA
ncbi:hypothetical protein HII31_04222 [Pseudocercospora fuligena]|uniref:Uncharacterized protein n=1 Tax=Pseudocercospora fuligena TaxID=685502 RepID=A0A8H6RNT0_9PEZI|nr:hypothetical protein HII31_04222 [Pseudocercospora fuligena]